MYAVLMKQMLYLKMLAWLEDNIYCNPAIDDWRCIWAIHVGLCTTCFTSMASYPSGSIFVCGG